MRLTIACPEAHIGDANDLAMVLGYGEPDSLTYGTPQWQDATGNRYAVCSLPIFGDFVGNAFGTLIRPIWDNDPGGYKISMAAAKRAQALVVLCDVIDPATWTAKPTQLTAMPGDDALLSLSMMGLVRILEKEV